MNVVVVGSGTYTSCYATETSSQQWDVVWSGITPSYGCTFRSIVITTKIGRTFTHTTTSGNAHFGGSNNEPVTATITFDGVPYNKFYVSTNTLPDAAKQDGASTTPSKTAYRVSSGAVYTINIEATPSTRYFTFREWTVSGPASYVSIANKNASATIATISIPEGAETFPDVTFNANYDGSLPKIRILAYGRGCVTSPSEVYGASPLTQRLVATPGRHRSFEYWGPSWLEEAQWITSRYDSTADLTATGDSVVYAYGRSHFPLLVIIEPDPTYGIISFSRGDDTRMPFFIDGSYGVGLSWWYGRYKDSWEYSSLKVTCADNPNNPPGVTYLGADYSDTIYPIRYNYDTNQWGPFVGNRTSSHDVVFDGDITGTRYGSYEENGTAYGGIVTFHYSVGPGGHILYGSNNSILHGTSGGILYGLNG